MGKWSSIICRFLFGAAFFLTALGVLEWVVRGVARLSGSTTVFRGFYYDPGRLLEFSAMALVFVIALQLREIKILLRGKGSN